MNFEHIFVYGLLRRGNKGEQVDLLERHAKFMCTGTLQGKLYIVDCYPGAVTSGNSVDVIHGDVYRVDEPDQLFPKLDEYEECGPKFHAPTEYIRRKEQIFLINGRSIYAWVYLYNRSVDALERIPSGRFDVTENREVTAGE